MINRRFSLLFLVGVTAFLGNGREAGAQTIQEVVDRAEDAVFQIVGEYGDGTGFLVDRARGLVLTNAHVTSGRDSVGVKLDLQYKVPGLVVHEDFRADVSIVAVSTEAVSDRPALVPQAAAYADARVGEEVIVMGFPLRRGVLTTRGIVSRRGERTFLVDATVAPGNSGGPVLDLDGNVLGMTTFLASRGTTAGIGGALTAPAIMEAVGSWATYGAIRDLNADSLPVIPADFYPIEALESAMWAEEWPDELYDLSGNSAASGYDVRLMTPAYLARHQGDIADLRYWGNEVAGYPPVVTIRIRSEVGQSTLAALANLVASATASASLPIRDPQARHELAAVSVQGQDGEFVVPLQVKRRITVVQGQTVPVLYLFLSPEMFIPQEGGSAVILNVMDAEGATLPWLVEQPVIEQVFRDFELYFDERSER